MFMIREVGTERYICTICEEVSITVPLEGMSDGIENHMPTKYNSIEDALQEITKLSEDSKWQVVLA